MISFIVPTFNNSEELKATLESIYVCKFDYEIIIINGGAKLSDYECENIYLIQENDNGVYDAMNKGLANCSNEYVIFLNSGDHLIAKNVPNLSEKKDIYLLDSMEIGLDGKQCYKKSKDIASLAYGMITHHQAMIFKREIIQKHDIKYNLAYKIAADYNFLLDFKKFSKTFEIIHAPLCVFHKGGLSHQQRYKGLFEQYQIRASRYNRFFALYTMCIQFLKIWLRYNAHWLYRIIKK